MVQISGQVDGCVPLIPMLSLHPVPPCLHDRPGPLRRFVQALLVGILVPALNGRKAEDFLRGTFLRVFHSALFSGSM